MDKAVSFLTDLFGGGRGAFRGAVGGLITYILADASLANAAGGAPTIVELLTSAGIGPGVIAIIGAIALAIRNRRASDEA